MRAREDHLWGERCGRLSGRFGPSQVLAPVARFLRQHKATEDRKRTRSKLTRRDCVYEHTHQGETSLLWEVEESARREGNTWE